MKNNKEETIFPTSVGKHKIIIKTCGHLMKAWNELCWTYFLLYSSLSRLTLAKTLYKALSSGVMVSTWTPTLSGWTKDTPGRWRVSNRPPYLAVCETLQIRPGSLDWHSLSAKGNSRFVWTACSRENRSLYCDFSCACCSWISNNLFLRSSSWTLERKQRKRRFSVFNTWMLEPRSFLNALVAMEPVADVSFIPWDIGLRTGSGKRRGKSILSLSVSSPD